MTDPAPDPFGPPKVPTLVGCLHCHQVYETYLIEWRENKDPAVAIDGFWCCPIEGCGGAGFGCDILPIDPDWTDEDGERMWVDTGDDDDFEEEGDYPEPGSDRPHHKSGNEEIPF